MNPQQQVLGMWAAAKSSDEVQLIDRDGDPIQVLGCECDLDRPCSVAECLMRQDFEARRQLARFRGLVTAGFDPAKTWSENVA